MSYDVDDATKTSFLFPGAGFGNGLDIKHCKSQEHVAAQLNPVPTRKSLERNATGNRFAHDVSLENIKLPDLGPGASELQAFQLHWWRSPDLSSTSSSR